MELKEFKKYIFHLDKFSASEVDDFEFMSSSELEEYQSNLETDAGSLSEWDHIRAFITMKKLLEKTNTKEVKEIDKSKRPKGEIFIENFHI